MKEKLRLAELLRENDKLWAEHENYVHEYRKETESATCDHIRATDLMETIRRIHGDLDKVTREIDELMVKLKKMGCTEIRIRV